MDRPRRFAAHRWLGDKRSQVVHDTDACIDEAVVRELLAAQAAVCFAPDTVAEARNRGYSRCRRCIGADVSADVSAG